MLTDRPSTRSRASTPASRSNSALVARSSARKPRTSAWHWTAPASPDPAQASQGEPGLQPKERGLQKPSPSALPAVAGACAYRVDSERLRASGIEPTGKTHGRLVIEDLCTIGLMRTKLARSVADSAWARFATMLTYKAKWYGAELTIADRFYPSTRRCSACGQVGEKLELSERTFHCNGCGNEADRNTNAAANLARYLAVVRSGTWSRVPAKRAETENARGEGSAGGRPPVVRETTLREAGRASAQRPRRTVLT